MAEEVATRAVTAAATVAVDIREDVAAVGVVAAAVGPAVEQETLVMNTNALISIYTISRASAAGVYTMPNSKISMRRFGQLPKSCVASTALVTIRRKFLSRESGERSKCASIGLSWPFARATVMCSNRELTIPRRRDSRSHNRSRRF